MLKRLILLSVTFAISCFATATACTSSNNLVATQPDNLKVLWYKPLHFNWTNLVPRECLDQSDIAIIDQLKAETVIAQVDSDGTDCRFSYYFKRIKKSEFSKTYITRSPATKVLEQADHKISLLLKFTKEARPEATEGHSGLSGGCRLLKNYLLSKPPILKSSAVMYFAFMNLAPLLHLIKEADANSGNITNPLERIMLYMLIELSGIPLDELV
jgi:hypothetical protein